MVVCAACRYQGVVQNDTVWNVTAHQCQRWRSMRQDVERPAISGSDRRKREICLFYTDSTLCDSVTDVDAYLHLRPHLFEISLNIDFFLQDFLLMIYLFVLFILNLLLPHVNSYTALMQPLVNLQNCPSTPLRMSIQSKTCYCLQDF